MSKLRPGAVIRIDICAIVIGGSKKFEGKDAWVSIDSEAWWWGWGCYMKKKKDFW